MAESKERPEIKFEFIKTKRPPPKGVLQKIAREFEDEAKEKKANEGKQTPSASQKMQNKKREEAIKRIENKKKNKDKKRNTFAGGVGESNRQKSMRANMKAGGALKAPANPGLKKLPTKVRNKMGYMKSGGKVGYSKGGIVDRQYLKGR